MRKLLTVLMIMILFPALAACGSSNSAIELNCDDLFRLSDSLGWIDVGKPQ